MSGEPDIRVADHGSLVTLRGMSERGEAWMREMIVWEPWQEFGGAIACEPRYVVDVIEGAVEDGLTVTFAS